MGPEPDIDNIGDHGANPGQGIPLWHVKNVFDICNLMSMGWASQPDDDCGYTVLGTVDIARRTLRGGCCRSGDAEFRAGIWKFRSAYLRR